MPQLVLAAATLGSFVNDDDDDDDGDRRDMIVGFLCP